MMINKKIEVHLPHIPNYILCGKDKQVVAIEDFTDEELKKIGEQFVLNLVLSAQTRRRKNK